MSRRQPTASAYFSRVAREGECFLWRPDASRRATAGVLVPIFLATSAWVKPAFFLALSISSKAQIHPQVRRIQRQILDLSSIYQSFLDVFSGLTSF